MELNAPGETKQLDDEHPLQRGVLYLALAALCIAPLIFGSYPQWISGFSAGAFCVLGAAHVLLSAFFRTEALRVPRSVAMLAITLVGWLSVTVIRDILLGVEHNRFPALSERVLPYAFAFLAAGILGSHFGNRRRFKMLLGALAGVGLILAVLTLAQWMGWKVTHAAASTIERPSGILINPNRFAVMEALCSACGLSLLLASIRDSDSMRFDSARTKIRNGMLAIAILIMWGSLAVTLSRLTIFAFGMGLGVAALIWVRNRNANAELAFKDLSRQERIQRVGLWILPIVVMLGWAIVAFSVGTNSLTTRYADIANSEGRVEAVKAALLLFNSNETKLFGIGLGSFEAIFTAVQPVSLAGRWSRLHCDWLQLALEAGFPALLLAVLLTLACGINWWRGLRAAGDERGRRSGLMIESKLLLRLVPVAGVLTVLVATGGDFPLRETGLALAFYFLMGALMSRQRDSNIEETRSPHFLTGAILALVLIPCFGWSAFVAGRNTLSCARSPWRGQLLLPVEAGMDLNAWKRSIGIDPDEPQLHYLLALAADNNAAATPEMLNEALEHVRIAEALAPREFHYPWLEATLSEKLEKFDAAEKCFDRASELFPENLKLKLDAGAFLLQHGVKNRHPGDDRRTAAMRKALGYFQFVIRYEPEDAKQISDWMDESGCDPDEIAAIWQGDGAAACLGRARFFCDQGLWERAAAAVEPLNPRALEASKHEWIWYHAVLGAIEYYNGNNERGATHWAALIPLGVVRNDSAAYYWTADRMSKLSPQAAEELAGNLGERLKSLPVWVNTLARKLADSGKYFSACALLEKTAGTTDYLCALWADCALEIGDFDTARLQALQVMRVRNQKDTQWDEWRADFERRLDERKRRNAEKTK